MQRYRAASWEVVVEYTFNNYGERGSVDLLCWRPTERALAANKVKTRLPDVQDVHAGIDRKARILPAVVARERGWRVTWVGRLLIVADTRANRRVVATHAGMFESSFPQRGRAAREWLHSPDGAISALWFMAYPNDARRHASRSRVRVRNRG